MGRAAKADPTDHTDPTNSTGAEPVAEPVFECLRCGGCCQGQGGVWLPADWVAELAYLLGLTQKSLIEGYLTRAGSGWSVRTGLDGFCAFFDPRSRGCQVQAKKPFSCRSWPFYWALLNSQSGFLEAQNLCPALAGWDYPTFLAAFKATGQKWPPKSLKKIGLSDLGC
jgi:Fe-S-cluster containining protein